MTQPDSPQGSPASPTTVAAWQHVAKVLDLADRGDFERATRGLLAQLDPPRILRADGNPAWDMGAYDFLEGEAPPTVNPSLWRQAQLNRSHGLFEVTPGIWQVRGYDISNITFIQGRSGWIVIDPLLCEETARASLELANAQLGERPVTAVIYTHSHVDHYAGVYGVTSDEDVRAGRTRIIAPEGFLEAAVSENVIAGNAMLRRAMYMYGAALAPGERGHVDVGLGKATSSGTQGLIAPTEDVCDTGSELVIDGVRFVFQVTPETEAPAELNFFLPEQAALCMAENCSANLHNLYTPRGAQVRDALSWSKYIQEAIELFGDRSQLMFICHHWPRWGRAEVLDFLEKQRDAYRYIHDQTMRLANLGQTPLEIAEQVELPDALAHEFYNRDYYGTVNHNCKAVYQRYLGWYDANPAHLHPHPPVEAARRYVEFMGGADTLLERARASFADGDYRWVAEVVNHLVFAEPENRAARELQADALEQLGYQAESGPWRNIYLTGAQDLRQGTPEVPFTFPLRRRTVAAMTVDMIFDLLGVRLDGPRAAGRALALNFEIRDRDERWLLRLQHGALHQVEGRFADDADATLRLDRATLDALICGELDVARVLATSEVSGRGEALAELWALLDEFPVFFKIVEP